LLASTQKYFRKRELDGADKDKDGARADGAKVMNALYGVVEMLRHEDARVTKEWIENFTAFSVQADSNQ
jgi:hypothetical protein